MTSKNDKEYVTPLDNEKMDQLSIYFNDINLKLDLARENEKLQQKIDKAIKCIEKHKSSLGFYEEIDGNELMSILKGKDNE